jgi:PAS domain S-box-containing protein
MNSVFKMFLPSVQQDILEGLLVNVNDAVIVINEQRRIIIFNRAAEVVFRCTEDFALNEAIEKFIPMRFQDYHSHYVEKFHQEGITHRRIGGGMQLWGLRADGEEFPADVSVARTLVQGQTFSVAVIRDMSEREKYQREIEELNKTLEARIAERTQHLIRLNQEKNEFLAMAAHDLRNPLTGITASAELIEMYTRKAHLDKLHPEKLQQITADILEAASRMTMLLEEMLDVGRIEFREQSVSNNIVETDLVDQMCDAYNGRAVLKNITIHLSESSDAPRAFYGDTHGVLRVFDNLLSNAVKYSPLNSDVWVNTSRHVQGEQTFLRVSVRDSGPGISKPESEKLFQKFGRLSTQPTGGESSIGLGLWIVKQLVNAMHGRIWYESGEGQGATFVVEFPAIP